MTNLEVLKGSISASFTDEKLSALLVKVGLEPTEIYTIENQKQIDLATIESIIILMGTSESVRELDYQVTQRSFNDLMGLLNILYAKWGLKNPYIANRVKGVSVW